MHISKKALTVVTIWATDSPLWSVSISGNYVFRMEKVKLNYQWSIYFTLTQFSKFEQKHATLYDYWNLKLSNTFCIFKTNRSPRFVKLFFWFLSHIFFLQLLHVRVLLYKRNKIGIYFLVINCYVKTLEQRNENTHRICVI